MRLEIHHVVLDDRAKRILGAAALRENISVDDVLERIINTALEALDMKNPPDGSCYQGGHVATSLAVD